MDICTVSLKVEPWEEKFDALTKRINELCKERNIARQNHELYWADCLTQLIEKLDNERLAIAMKHIK